MSVEEYAPFAALAEAARGRVTQWVWAARETAVDQGPDVLGAAHEDRAALAFTERLLELLVRQGDPFQAALGLRAAAWQLPESLPVADRLAMRLGGIASLGLPWAVLPIVRGQLRERVSHLVVAPRLPADSTRPSHLVELQEALRPHLAAGTPPVISLYGPHVLGPAAVEREAEHLIALAAQPEVTHLRVDPVRLVPGGSDWSFEADLEIAAKALYPVLDAVTEHGVSLTIDARSYRSARLGPELLRRIAGDPRYLSARLGVVLPAELPESREHTESLLRASAARVADGGEPLELVVRRTGLAPVERVRSIHSGLADPTLTDGVDQQAHLLVLCRRIVTSGRAELVVGTEDPFVIAGVLELAHEHSRRVAVEVRAGAAPQLARTLSGQVQHGLAGVRVLLPLAARGDFAWLVQPLLEVAAEAADPHSAMRGFENAVALARGEGQDRDESHRDGDLAEDGGDPGGEDSREIDRLLAAALSDFEAALERAEQPFPVTHRTQLRDREWDPSERDSALFYRAPDDTERFDTGGLTAAVLGLTQSVTGVIHLDRSLPGRRVPVISQSGFANEPDTDATRAENRTWLRDRLAMAARVSTPAAHPVLGREGEESVGAETSADAAITGVLTVGDAWRAEAPETRATVLRRLALATVAARDRLIEVSAAESGAPVAQLDAGVSGVIDAARYHGQLAESLGKVRGATFLPDRVTLVVADAGVPLKDRAEAVLAALAAGAAVIHCVHETLAASSEALISEWEAAGLPARLVMLRVATAEVADNATEIATDARVDRAIVLGKRSTARRIMRHRPELRVQGRFVAANALVATPSADTERAVLDVVDSAFGAAWGDASRIRCLILVGKLGRSRRFIDALEDAVRGLRAGHSVRATGVDPLGFDVGPLTVLPDAAGLRALTSLDDGETWLVRPERLDETGLLWSPGVRTGVRAGSRFWDDAAGMPVLGVMTARTLGEAQAWQSSHGGAVAGIITDDETEAQAWLARARASALFVNRATTDGRVERQPWGGRDDAGIGTQPLAAGPNRLVTLGSWESREGTRSSTLHLRGLSEGVRALIEVSQSSLAYESFDRVRRAALADALTWRTEFGVVRDTIGLGVERNAIRHVPVASHVRLGEQGELADLVRVLAAALLVEVPVSVSTGVILPGSVLDLCAAYGIEVSLERDEAWLERIAVQGPTVDGVAATRIRLIGGDRARTASWLGGLDRVSVWADEVTMAGPVELLTFLREQSISVTTHRYGVVQSTGLVEG